jgi:hypothetical protein
MNIEQLVEWRFGGMAELGENLPSVKFYPPQIPFDLTRYRTWTAAVRSRPLTTWAVYVPILFLQRFPVV